MEMEPIFLPVLMDFTLKSTAKCLSITAANLVPNLYYARQEVSLALTLRETVRNAEMKKGKIYLGGGSS